MRVPTVVLLKRNALLIATALGLLYLILSTLAEKGVDNANRLVAIILFISSVIVFIRIEFPSGFSAINLKHREGRTRATAVTFGVFAVMSGALGLMAPRPAVEDKPRHIQSTVDAIAVSMGLNEEETALDKLLTTKVSRSWGESGCRADYFIKLTRDAMVVTSDKIPEGGKSHRWRFTVEKFSAVPITRGMHAYIITAIEREGFRPGDSVKFRYYTDGITQQLVWDSEGEQPTIKLTPC